MKNSIASLLYAMVFIMVGCKKNIEIPTERIPAINFQVKRIVKKDSLEISFDNHLKCPLQVKIRKPQDKVWVSNAFDSIYGIEPLGKFHEAIHIPSNMDTNNLTKNFKLSISFGHPDSVKEAPILALPFPEGKTYKIMQGHNGSFSHNNDNSRYAIDFTLPIGDTIAASERGVVITNIDGYTVGGNDSRLRDFGNYINIYHPSGYITSYVHLDYQGSFVELGDTVKRNQPIGISGYTGYTTAPHLHFNVFKPTKGKVISWPLDFENGLKAADLKRGMKIQR